jgi:hypothetical protein
MSLAARSRACQIKSLTGLAIQLLANAKPKQRRADLFKHSQEIPRI